MKKWLHAVYCLQNIMTSRWSFQKGRGRIEFHLKYKAGIQTSQWRELLPVQIYIGENKNPDWFYVHLNQPSTQMFYSPEYALLCNKQRVKEVCRDPACIYGTCSHAADACSDSINLFPERRLNVLTELYLVYRNSPLRIKLKPDRTVRRALVVSEPPIFVHFIPSKAKAAPKKPRQTAAIIKPRQTWI